MPGIGEAPQHVIHEGERTRIIRSDGSTEDSELKEASAEFVVRFDEAAEMSPQARAAKLDEIAESMARQISQHAFASINATLEAKGQVFDNAGRPLDAEAILATLEKLQMDFDQRGKPNGLSIVVGPEIAERTRREYQRLMTEPALRRKFEALIQRKRMDWRDREAARKLVG
ncbi:MAG: hypothetical protein CVU22_18310 [Betaproteobacteria bacterium HGW-Betaproteobacteria-16]|nr:MAG: hypothetical protein CVU22_18310 [Betaproteobacteria bacterium HGW-Betaproteobacteria-16]